MSNKLCNIKYKFLIRRLYEIPVYNANTMKIPSSYVRFIVTQLIIAISCRKYIQDKRPHQE